jgi:pilus assembly protein CpaE
VSRLTRSHPTKKTRVLVLTADSDFETSVRSTFGVSPQIELRVISATIAGAGDNIDPEGITVIVIDLDTARDDEMSALERLMARTGGWPPVVVVTQGFNAAIARSLMQMRIADFLVKPVSPVDLVHTCARVTKPTMTDASEAEIYTFLAAVGGAGATTLAIQTALLLLSSGKYGRASACLVDLNFQHGACADYLDLEARLDLKEIEPRPERLDRRAEPPG